MVSRSSTNRKKSRIVLGPEAFYNMLFNGVEETHREVAGDLIGRKVQGAYYIINSRAALNTFRKPMEVMYSNCSARDRVLNVARILNHRYQGLSIVGHYHSHIVKPGDREEDHLVFSEHDLHAYREEMEDLGVSPLANILISIRYRKRPNSKKEVWSVDRSGDTLHATIRERTREYSLRFAAFELFPFDRERVYEEKRSLVFAPFLHVRRIPGWKNGSAVHHRNIEQS